MEIKEKGNIEKANIMFKNKKEGTIRIKLIVNNTILNVFLSLADEKDYSLAFVIIQ